MPHPHEPCPNPQTPQEWQTAVNLAEFVLTIDSLKQYGLIETDLLYSRERAIALLTAGEARGYFSVQQEPAPEPLRRKRGRPRKIR